MIMIQQSFIAKTFPIQHTSKNKQPLPKQVRYPDWADKWKKNHLTNHYSLSMPSLTKTTEVGRQKVVPYHDYDTTIIYSQNFSNTTYVKK